jgi:protein TonB
MVLTRYLIGISFAILVTAGLFLLMPLLIQTADHSFDDQPYIRLADITMPKRDIDTRIKELKPEKPDTPDEPPPNLEPLQQEDFDVSPDVLNMAPQTRMDLSLAMGGGLGSSDGEFLPIVKVAPMYPRRANSRGVEGYCTVEYTVTKSGAVRDVRAIDCQPVGFFERVSVRAATKFKYKPRVIDGEAVDVVGVRNRFTFELEK